MMKGQNTVTTERELYRMYVFFNYEPAVCYYVRSLGVSVKSRQRSSLSAATVIQRLWSSLCLCVVRGPPAGHERICTSLQWTVWFCSTCQFQFYQHLFLMMIYYSKSLPLFSLFLCGGQLLKTQSVCGAYDAFLAHADTDAVDFFSRCGLTDDALLNDKFRYWNTSSPPPVCLFNMLFTSYLCLSFIREVRDEWTNTTLMSYLPPFTTGEPPDIYHTGSSILVISINPALPSSLPPESESRNPGFSLMLPELKLEVEMAWVN